MADFGALWASSAFERLRTDSLALNRHAAAPPASVFGKTGVVLAQNLSFWTCGGWTLLFARVGV